MLSQPSGYRRWFSDMRGVRSSLYRVLLIVIALIVYGSLYPWDFHSAQLAANPLWVLIHSWPTAIDRFLFRDIAVNLLLYMPVGVFGFLGRYKGFDTVVRALHHLPKEYHLLIFGGIHPNEIKPHQQIDPVLSSLFDAGFIDTSPASAIAIAVFL